jgi:hypothetical protein
MTEILIFLAGWAAFWFVVGYLACMEVEDEDD